MTTRSLLVEGPHDVAVLTALLHRHVLDARQLALEICEPDPAIGKGWGALIKDFKVRAKSPNTRLGLVLDADSDLDNKWKHLRAALDGTGLVLPEGCPGGGFLGTGPLVDQWVGVWLMPDNLQGGALEDLLVTLIPDADSLWTHASTATEQARQLGAQFKASHILKAQLYAWLAWQKKPGLALGNALRHGYFRHDSALATKFVDWCRALFDLSPPTTLG
jgi:hypothetical protein